MKKWIKRDTASSIEEVVSRNTGLSVQELNSPKINPFLKGLKEVCDVIRQAIASDSPITIVGDYDCDGVTSSTILSLGLKELTGKEPEVIIPKRFSEGYGLNMSIVDRIEKGLMLTVDNGISAVEQVEKARNKGLMVAIIDHHIKREDGILPPANAILDPHAIEGSEYDGYCGAGLAYRVIMELNPNSQIKDKLIALAGIGTVADVMVLLGDNRRLVKESLKAVADKRVTLGTRLLCEVMGIGVNPTETDYGFKIGPAVNAAGRLEDAGASKVYQLLKIDTNAPEGSFEFGVLADRCREKAQELALLNATRQKMVFTTMYRVEKALEGKEITPPIVYYDPSINEGIVGIIAGRLCEKYNMPAIVFTNSSKEGVIKGSGRSIDEIHLKELLDSVSDHLLGYGGHAGAAGLSANYSELEDLEQALKNNIDSSKCKTSDEIYYDLELDERDIPQVCRELMRFAPYGEGNPPIVFRLKGFTATPVGSSHYSIMGNLKNHIKIHGTGVSVMGFDMVKRYSEDKYPNRLDVVGMLSEHWYKGDLTYNIEALDYKALEAEHTEAYNNLKAMFCFA